MSLNRSIKFSPKIEAKSYSHTSDQVFQLRKGYTDEDGGSNMNYDLAKKGSYDYVGEDSS